MLLVSMPANLLVLVSLQVSRELFDGVGKHLHLGHSLRSASNPGVRLAADRRTDLLWLRPKWKNLPLSFLVLSGQ